MRQLDRARDAGAEADAVVRAVDVVVHRLGDGDDVHAFVVQTLGVAERVVAPDRDQDVDADVLEILEHILGDVVDLVAVSREVLGHARAREMARTRARRVEKGSAGATGAIDDRFGELLHGVGVVRLLVAPIIDEPPPPTPDADDSVSLAQSADGDRTDGGVEAGDVSAAGQNRDGPLACRHGPKNTSPLSRGRWYCTGTRTAHRLTRSVTYAAFQPSPTRARSGCGDRGRSRRRPVVSRGRSRHHPCLSHANYVGECTRRG